MSGILIWKDGHREVTEHAGGIYVIHCRQVEGRFVQTTFEAFGFEDGAMVYRESKSEDVTARFREADERLRSRTFEQLGIRRPHPGAFAKGQYPGETAAEMRRRVNLMHGREPEDDG